MQSGRAKTKKWLLRFDDIKSGINPLMGWESSTNTMSEINLEFSSQEDAVKYAKKKGIPYTVLNANSRKHIIRENGYGDNFAYNKKIPWTH